MFDRKRDKDRFETHVCIAVLKPVFVSLSVRQKAWEPGSVYVYTVNIVATMCSSGSYNNWCGRGEGSTWKWRSLLRHVFDPIGSHNLYAISVSLTEWAAHYAINSSDCFPAFKPSRVQWSACSEETCRCGHCLIKKLDWIHSLSEWRKHEGSSHQ